MITILYACNDSYIKQTIVSMISVLKCNVQVKFYLVGDNLSQESMEQLYSIMENYGQTIHIFDIKNILPDFQFNSCDRHPRTVYAKLFVESVVSESKLLYLDSDTVVISSLESLFERDMSQELVAGVLMPYSSRIKERVGSEAGKPYVCDGIVLFNMELWKTMGKSSECAKYICAYAGNPPMLSEGTLNHVCIGKIGILEPKYNLMPAMLMYRPAQMRQLFQPDFYYTDAESIFQAKFSPVIIHFMNELYNRPWFEPCDHPWKNFYRDIHETIFGNSFYARENISLNVRLTKTLFKILPFSFFAWLYHVRHFFDRNKRQDLIKNESKSVYL